MKKGWNILVSSKMRARVLGLVKSARSEIYCLFLSLVVTENVIGGFSEVGNTTRQLACSNKCLGDELQKTENILLTS